MTATIATCDEIAAEHRALERQYAAFENLVQNAVLDLSLLCRQLNELLVTLQLHF